MPDSDQETPAPGFGLNDVLYAVFRHKWKILFCSAVGLGAAIALYFFQTRAYESQAKLLVRYVVERIGTDAQASEIQMPGSSNQALIGAEIQILTSWDLAEEVAEAVTVERLLPGGGETATKVAAARALLKGLSVVPDKSSNVIVVSYKHRDPRLATQVVEEFVNRYFVKHLEIHRSVGAFNFVTQQADQVRAQLHRTEDELKKLKARAGVISLAESKTNLNAALAKVQGELQSAEAEHAAQQAHVTEMEKWLSGAPAEPANPSGTDAQQPDRSDIQTYKSLFERLGQLRQKEQELLATYTPETSIVKLHQAQIATLGSQLRDLEKKFPRLAATSATIAPGSGPQPDIGSEKARLAAIEGKREKLDSQLRDLQQQAEKLSEAGPPIAQLERKKEQEEANLKFFEISLQKTRIDEALDPSKLPNIALVQRPSPALRTISDLKKVILGLAGGGVVFGIALALLIELLFDRTIKRPSELAGQLQIPLLLTLPFLGRNGKLRLGSSKKAVIAQPGTTNDAAQTLAPWDPYHFIRPFTTAIRDRLVLEFELKKMHFKPKLLAVAGCSGGEGTSTIAAGLAAALSETGDGKVLLLDMNLGSGALHHFFEGKQTCSLCDILEGVGSVPSAADNLYLAKAPPAEGTSHIIPKRFYALVPQFKATDFDYIVFDMPPMNQGSVTLAMAGFMDKILLVVGSEISGRDVVKRAYEELSATRANVSAILNKQRSYAPKWLPDGI